MELMDADQVGIELPPPVCGKILSHRARNY